MGKGGKFLADKYKDLPGSKPVRRAEQKKLAEGEKGASDKEELVDRYLARLEGVISNPKAFAKYKSKILEENTIAEDAIPESYWESHEKILRERGQLGDWNRLSAQKKKEEKHNVAEAAINDQRSSLEQWINYFSSGDADYIPTYLKYWIFRSVIKMAPYDGEKKSFPKRSGKTLQRYPEINSEALAYAIDAVIEKHKKEGVLDADAAQMPENFKKILEKEDFSKLYAWSNENLGKVPPHLLALTEGEWRKYQRGSDPLPLVQSLRGRGTGWCTAGKSTAKTQLERGDFYVYYTKDDDNNLVIPRVAIRMEGSGIGEVRGIGASQNMDPFMGAVVEQKLKEFPDGTAYIARERDMKWLTAIDTKQQNSEELSAADLRFLYELDNKIQGFGYSDDPRIWQLRQARNENADMIIVLNAYPDDQVSFFEKRPKLLELLDSIQKPDYMAIAKGVLDKNAGAVIQYIDKFPQNFRKEIGEILFERVPYMLPGNLAKFPDIDQVLLRQKLLEPHQHSGWAVAEHIQNFNKLDKEETAIMLARNGVRDLAKYFDRFGDVSLTNVFNAIDSEENRMHFAMVFSKDFPSAEKLLQSVEINHQKYALELMVSSREDLVTTLITKKILTGVDVEVIAERMRETMRPESSIGYLAELGQKLSREDAKKILDSTYAYQVVRYPYMFEGLDQNELIKEIISSGKLKELKDGYTWNFSGLSSETAVMLIRKGLIQEVVRNIGNFKSDAEHIIFDLALKNKNVSFDYNLRNFTTLGDIELARLMEAYGEKMSREIGDNLYKYKDLGRITAGTLIRTNKNYGAYDVQKSIESFRPSEHDVIANMIMDNGNLYEETLNKMQNLSPKTVSRYYKQTRGQRYRNSIRGRLREKYPEAFPTIAERIFGRSFSSETA